LNASFSESAAIIVGLKKLCLLMVGSAQTCQYYHSVLEKCQAKSL